MENKNYGKANIYKNRKKYLLKSNCGSEEKKIKEKTKLGVTESVCK